MTDKLRSPLSLVAGTLAGLGIALVLNAGVAAAAPTSPPPPPGNPIVLIVVCTTTPDKTQLLQCTPSTSTSPTAPNTVIAPITTTTTLGTSTASDAIDGNTDIRVDTYAKRQAIRDQYRGRINETTFNDELADGVSLDQALKDAMAEVNAQSPTSR